MVFDNHQDMYHLKIIEIFIDNGEDITIRSDSSIDKILHNYIQHYVSIQGSFTNYSSMCLNPARYQYFQNMGTLNNVIQETYDSLGFQGPLLERLYKSVDALNTALYNSMFYTKGDPEVDKNKLGFFLPIYNASKHAPFWMDIYNSLDSSQRESFYGKYLKEISILCVGQPFPEFKLADINGNLVALNDIKKKSKVTIVHFWAANSVNRLKYGDELRTMYEKYHQKGLNIVGVFCDNSFLDSDKYTKVDAKQQWRDIVQTEKYPWLNVADLKGKGGIVDSVYRECEMNVGNNTTNVLIDSNGKIIAWDARGCDLKYYLWKYFDQPFSSK
jgi:glutathione peroxidase-family protein